MMRIIGGFLGIIPITGKAVYTGFLHTHRYKGHRQYIKNAEERLGWGKRRVGSMNLESHPEGGRDVLKRPFRLLGQRDEAQGRTTMTTKKELEEKRDRLRTRHIEGVIIQFPNQTWDEDPLGVIKEARKLVFAWLIADTEENLASTSS